MSKSKSSDKNMGAKNQVYYAKLNNRCPPALMPMLTTIVNGSLKSKSTLLKTAREAGLFALPPSSLPPNCPPLSNMYLDPSAELLVVLYEALLGSRRVRGTSAIVELIKGQKANLQKTLAMKARDISSLAAINPIIMLSGTPSIACIRHGGKGAVLNTQGSALV